MNQTSHPPIQPDEWTHGDPLYTRHPLSTNIESLHHYCEANVERSDPTWIKLHDVDSEEFRHSSILFLAKEPGIYWQFKRTELDSGNVQSMIDDIAGPLLDEEGSYGLEEYWSDEEEEEGEIGQTEHMEDINDPDESEGREEFASRLLEEDLLIRREDHSYENQSVTRTLACAWSKSSTYLRTADDSTVRIQIFKNPPDRENPAWVLMRDKVDTQGYFERCGQPIHSLYDFTIDRKVYDTKLEKLEELEREGDQAEVATSSD
ncbi:hypothetical protein M231_05609 [Tremella mesenterica]|uniref:Uncharacterized protein n=1 Tax=Tremella mesenterica TaxID=5217 RepID=A0A4V1M3K2_TREME|nr:hypothetical protein M231_05609 [Tremella mesenterica]